MMMGNQWVLQNDPEEVVIAFCARSSSVKRVKISVSGLLWVMHQTRCEGSLPSPHHQQFVRCWLCPLRTSSAYRLQTKDLKRKVQLQVTISPTILQPRDAWWLQGKEPQRRCHSEVFCHLPRGWCPGLWAGRATLFQSCHLSFVSFLPWSS